MDLLKSHTEPNMRDRQLAQFKSLGTILAVFLFATAVITVPAQPRKPATAFRSITIVTEPNSTVWIDGVRYGVTDEKGRLATSGVTGRAHSIRVRSNGFSEIVKGLPAASRGDVEIKLTKTTDEAELAFQAAESLTTVDRQKAIAEYQRAITLRPKFPEAYVGMARMYSETGDLEKADKAIRAAKRLKPGYAEASAVEGRLLKDADEEDRAIVVFKRAIAEGKGFQPEAYTGLGLLYKDRAENAGASGEYDKENANYNESAKNLSIAVKQLGGAPDAIIVYQLVGLIYERQKKFNEAIALYENFLAIFPNAAESDAVRSFIVQIKKQMAEQK
ncbi:MAG: tetratricopeptide repeat protein [Acidobacteriota bacterium]